MHVIFRTDHQYDLPPGIVDLAQSLNSLRQQVESVKNNVETAHFR